MKKLIVLFTIVALTLTGCGVESKLNNIKVVESKLNNIKTIELSKDEKYVNVGNVDIRNTEWFCLYDKNCIYYLSIDNNYQYIVTRLLIDSNKTEIYNKGIIIDNMYFTRGYSGPSRIEYVSDSYMHLTNSLYNTNTATWYNKKLQDNFISEDK